MLEENNIKFEPNKAYQKGSISKPYIKASRNFQIIAWTNTFLDKNKNRVLLNPHYGGKIPSIFMEDGKILEFISMEKFKENIITILDDGFIVEY